MQIATSNFTSGHISHALDHFNRAIAAYGSGNSLVDIATQLDRGLNKLQNEWLFSQPDKSLGEVAQFKGLISSGVEGERRNEFLASSELGSFVFLEPMVLNQKYLNDHGYIPGTDLSPSLQKGATDVHRRLRSAYRDGDARADKVITLAAELLYIVRSNIAHGEKTAFGADTDKSARDESVCRATIPVQLLLIDILLHSPSTRLVVYGSLAPGQNNHAILAPLKGIWQDCGIRGSLTQREELWAFTWNPSGEEVQAKLFESAELKGYWERIDRFEGARYRRQFVLAKTSTAVCVANAYVAS